MRNLFWVTLLAATASCSARYVDVPGDIVAVDREVPQAAPQTVARCGAGDALAPGCPVRITRDARDDIEPTVSEGRVAWLRRAFSNGATTWDLYVRDLRSGAAERSERRIAENVSAPWLSGSRVVYLRGGALFANHIDGNAETAIPLPPNAQGVDRPMLAGDWVVFSVGFPQSETWGDDSGVFAYNLATRETRTLARRGPFMQRWPSISGTQVVFSDDQFGHHYPNPGFHLMDLFAVDLAQGSDARRVTHRVDIDQQVGVLAISGTRVVSIHSKFSGEPLTETCQLEVIDTQSGQRSPLGDRGPCGSLRGQDRAFTLEGDELVLEQDANGRSDLVYVNLANGARTVLTTHGRRSTGPRLSGGLLVWQDDRNDDWEIYAMDVSRARDGVLYPEGVTP